MNTALTVLQAWPSHWDSEDTVALVAQALVFLNSVEGLIFRVPHQLCLCLQTVHAEELHIYICNVIRTCLDFYTFSLSIYIYDIYWVPLLYCTGLQGQCLFGLLSPLQRCPGWITLCVAYCHRSCPTLLMDVYLSTGIWNGECLVYFTVKYLVKYKFVQT